MTTLADFRKRRGIHRRKCQNSLISAYLHIISMKIPKGIYPVMLQTKLQQF